MALSVDELQQYLQSREFRYYESVDSSNDLAAEWLKSGAPSGSVIVADEQRKGRGRLGRIWYTPPNVALALSVITYPDAQAANRMSMLGAISVAELCDAVGIADVGIKWPNDVLIQGKKVCGVLPEAVWEDGKLLGVILGMGVNIRVSFGDELNQTATNIETEAGKKVNRSQLVGILLERVDYWLARLNSDEFLAAWQNRLITLGKSVTATEQNGRQISGIAESVDRDGALLIRTEDGELERVVAGDVTLRREL